MSGAIARAGAVPSAVVVARNAPGCNKASRSRRASHVGSASRGVGGFLAPGRQSGSFAPLGLGITSRPLRIIRADKQDGDGQNAPLEVKEIDQCLMDEDCKMELVDKLEAACKDDEHPDKDGEESPTKGDGEESAGKTVVEPTVVSVEATTVLNTGTGPKTAAKDTTLPATAAPADAKAGAAGAAAAAADPDVKVSEPPLNFERLKSVGTIKRTIEIWSFVFAFVIRRVLVSAKWSYKGGFTEEKKLKRTEGLAEWLRLGLLRLGPTFIKIGQQFSTRVDVLSKPFIRELEKLQDKVPPFPTPMAREILEAELGKPVEEVFDEFEEEALAAASLGQVHLARIKETGEKVIVKVQRPGLKEIFDIDLKNLRVIAQWLQKVDPKTDGAARDWVAIFDETARCLYDEVDYKNEAANATEFAKQFAGVDWIKVPKIYWEYTATKCLCMEYAPAVKINDLEGLREMGVEPDRMARLAVESYLQQVLRFGFFHADPHPGNVAVDAGDAEGKGRLVVYDYGMMGRIPDDVRGGLLDLFYATFEKNADNACKALSKMGVLVEGGDQTAVKRTADFFLNSFDQRVKTQEEERETDKESYESEFKGKRTKEEKQAVRKRILSNIGEDLLVVSKDQPFRFPAEFTFVVRAFSVLDGIGKTLNKKFDIGEIAAPYARDLLIQDNPNSLPPQLVTKQRNWLRRADAQTKAVVNLFKGPDALADVADILRRVESGKLKIRVRALEAERALDRVQVMQDIMLKTMVACCAANIGAVLFVSSVQLGAKCAFGLAAFMGMQAVVAQLKLSKLLKKEAQYSGA